MGVCVKCGRPLGDDNDYDGWCGMCDYCPRCGRLVDRIHIYQNGNDSYCVWCQDDYLESLQNNLNFTIDFDDTSDNWDEEEDDALDKTQPLELSGETKIKVLKPEKQNLNDIISILKSIIKIAFYLTLLVGLFFAIFQQFR